MTDPRKTLKQTIKKKKNPIYKSNISLKYATFQQRIQFMEKKTEADFFHFLDHY